MFCRDQDNVSCLCLVNDLLMSYAWLETLVCVAALWQLQVAIASVSIYNVFALMFILQHDIVG